MRSNSKVVLAVCAVAFMVAGPVANADLIIDTGVPTETGGGWSLDSSYWMAGEITLAQDYTLTGIEGYFFEIITGDITVAIYDDGGTVPGNTELYSATFFGDVDGWNGAWAGPNGLSWDLVAGTYWVAFEVRSGNSWFAMPAGAPNPLSDYAGYLPPGVWNTDSFWGDDSMGFRVYGDISNSVVPEPATVSLLGLGLLGMAARRVRLRKKGSRG